MFSLFHSGLCPIGIDVGTHALRMVQFRPSAEGLRLQAACRIELDSLDAGSAGVARAAAAVRHGLSGQDFRGRSVVLALPASCVHSKSVRLPQMPDSDLHQALQWEARDRFGFDIGNGSGQLVWFRAGEVRRGTEVKDEILLFAVEGGVLNDYIQSLTDLGLRLAAIDLGPCAIYRARRRTSDGIAPSALSAILDIGQAGSQFFVVRGEDLVFYKHIEIGGKALNEAVAAKLGITVPEALQVRTRMLAQTAEDAAPLTQAVADALAMVGRQAGAAQLRETLAAALGLPVEEAQPLRGIQDLGAAARPDRSGEWALAAGLSLYPALTRAGLEAAA